MRQLLILVLFLTISGVLSGPRKGKSKKNVCKYQKPKQLKNQWTECVDGHSSLAINLVDGPESCDQTRTLVRECMNCSYEITWGECDANNMRLMTKTLVAEQSDAECEPTEQKEKKCRNARGERAGKCKYEIDVGECQADNTLTITRTLLVGQENCEREKTKVKKCGAGPRRGARKGNCTYSVEFNPCDPETQRRNVTRTLVEGDEECEDQWTKEGKCRVRNAHKDGNCKYILLKEPCDMETNKRMFIKKLVPEMSDGDCQERFERERVCGIGKPGKGQKGKAQKCKINRSAKVVGECDPVTNRRTITMPWDESRSDPACEPKTFTKTIPCKSKSKKADKMAKKMKKRKLKKMMKQCDYDIQQSPCDQATKKVTLTFNVKGDNPNCPQRPAKTIPCRKARKKFGPAVSGTSSDGNRYSTSFWKRPLAEVRGRKSKRGPPCKYKRGDWGDCNQQTNQVTRTLTLKRGDAAHCERTKSETRPCRKLRKKDKRLQAARVCKYRRVKWGPCDPSTQTVTRTLTLRKGDQRTCNSTKIETRACKKKPKKGAKCKYTKNPWGPCEAATNMVTRTLTLKKGDAAVCNATLTEQRKCKNKHLKPHECKYKQTTWGDCDPVTNMKTMVKTLKRGDPAYCVATETIVKKCKRVAKQVCRYALGEWSPCNQYTNTMTRTLTLKRGNPASCTQIKTNTRQCKVACKFKGGQWSECNPETHQQQKIERLTRGSASFCNATRTLVKKCGKSKRCVYNMGEWGECNEDTNKRSRVRTLKTGDPEQCEAEKSETKPCVRKNGRVSCFFGKWGEYGPCMNGVQKKQRQVLQGGVECERRGVKMKPCKVRSRRS